MSHGEMYSIVWEKRIGRVVVGIIVERHFLIGQDDSICIINNPGPKLTAMCQPMLSPLSSYIHPPRVSIR